MSNICLQNVAESTYTVAENGNTQVKNKYLKIVLRYTTWVNVLSYIPPQLNTLHLKNWRAVWLQCNRVVHILSTTETHRNVAEQVY